jgi:hypothetical protein
MSYAPHFSGARTREDLVAERIAVESYAEVIRYLGDADPATRRMLEGILANEEEHAEDGARSRRTEPGRWPTPFGRNSGPAELAGRRRRLRLPRLSW